MWPIARHLQTEQNPSVMSRKFIAKVAATFLCYSYCQGYYFYSELMTQDTSFVSGWFQGQKPYPD